MNLCKTQCKIELTYASHCVSKNLTPRRMLEKSFRARALTWEWPKTAKNRGEPQKMTPSSETENFLGGVPMGKLWGFGFSGLWGFRHVGNKTFDFSSKKRLFQ